MVSVNTAATDFVELNRRELNKCLSGQFSRFVGPYEFVDVDVSDYLLKKVCLRLFVADYLLDNDYDIIF